MILKQTYLHPSISSKTYSIGLMLFDIKNGKLFPIKSPWTIVLPSTDYSLFCLIMLFLNHGFEKQAIGKVLSNYSCDSETLFLGREPGEQTGFC